MSHIDIRYLILPLINLLKSKAGTPWLWDPFNIIIQNHQQSLRLSVYTFFFLLLFFSLTSIQFPLPCSYSGTTDDPRHIIVRVGDFSATFFFSGVAALIFPQVIFWYAYPAIVILLSPRTPRLLKISFNGLVSWWRSMFQHQAAELTPHRVVPVPPMVSPADNATDLERQHQAADVTRHRVVPVLPAVNVTNVVPQDQAAELTREEEYSRLEDGIIA